MEVNARHERGRGWTWPEMACGRRLCREAHTVCDVERCAQVDVRSSLLLLCGRPPARPQFDVTRIPATLVIWQL